MPESTSLSRSKAFTRPRWHFYEQEIVQGATLYVNQELLKVSRPTLVDYIWISDESFTVNGWPLAAAIAAGQHTTAYTGGLNVNWWVSDRARTDLRLRPIQMYDNYSDCNRTPYRLPALVPPGNANVQGPILYRFREPWRYNPGNTFTIDWQYVTGDATVNAPNLPAMNVAFYGVGVYTRHRRVFELQMPALVLGAGVLQSGSFTQTEFVSNQADEPYDIDELQIGVMRTAGNWVDLRQFNMLRYRIVPSSGEPFSDDPIPILAYGIDMTTLGRGAIYAPAGGPMLLLPGQSIGFEVQNTNGAGGIDYRFQTCLVGRTSPDRYA